MENIFESHKTWHNLIIYFAVENILNYMINFFYQANKLEL